MRLLRQLIVINKYWIYSRYFSSLSLKFKAFLNPIFRLNFSVTLALLPLEILFKFYHMSTYSVPGIRYSLLLQESLLAFLFLLFINKSTPKSIYSLPSALSKLVLLKTLSHFVALRQASKPR